MKIVFLIIWAALSLLLLAASGLYLWRQPSVTSALVFSGVLYYAYCFLRLILAAYRPWGVLGPGRGGNWLCLLLLPLSLMPLHSAYQIWLAGGYTPEPQERRWRLSIELGQQALVGLQELVGYLGPVLLLSAAGLGMAAFLWSLRR
jgi:hypothetical protein